MSSTGEGSSGTVQCHYEVLGVEQTADAATIKKSHRKLALKWHPDKNGNDPAAAENFRKVQEAYECLSDPMERKWYDDHRDAILAGWTSGGGADGVSDDILFDVVPYTYAGCFRGYGDDDGGYYAVYRSVFQKIFEGEAKGTRTDGSSSVDYLSEADFGHADSPWQDVQAFYQGWESFSSGLNFAWADMYDIKEAPNRRVRRAMEDENKKARRTAKRARNDDVLALVRFVKKRDPRVQQKMAELEVEKLAKEKQRRDEEVERKRQAQQAKEDWKLESAKNMAQQEEEDRLAGRLRLADLEDDYDYGGGRKKGKKKKGKKKQPLYEDNEPETDDTNNPSEFETPQTHESATDEGDVAETVSDDVKEAVVFDENNAGSSDLKDISAEMDGPDDFESSSEEEEEEEEPDVWRCECCRKDFKSEGQMENHMKSKKHKEAYKKYQKKMESQMMDDFLVS